MYLNSSYTNNIVHHYALKYKSVNHKKLDNELHKKGGG